MEKSYSIFLTYFFYLQSITKPRKILIGLNPLTTNYGISRNLPYKFRSITIGYGILLFPVELGIIRKDE